MKYVIAMLVLVHQLSGAQIQLPELSPEANTIEQVGYTTFKIRHGRPAARQRKIMGELVPYGKLWRTGAGKCSMIAFDTPVEINGKKIPAGAYALVTIPDEMEWKVMLNSDTSKLYGDPKEYDARTEVISFNVTPGKSDRYYESLTMSIDIIRYDAIFFLSWENTQISFPIKTYSYERAVSEIRKSVQQNPDDPEQLSQAAFFYFMNNDDPQQILAWLDKALQAGDERWILQQRFDILERMQKYDEAAQAAEQAIAFLTRTKPDSWEEGVQGYKESMRRWPKR
jgi:tetratricopeptide (TPR) repeat protein